MASIVFGGKKKPQVPQDIPVLGAPPAQKYPAPTNWGGGNPAQQQGQVADAMAAQAPPGFNASKWADPNWNTTKYTGGRIIAGGGTASDILANDLYAGWQQLGEDKVRSPSGAEYDVAFDYGGPQQRAQWTRKGGTGSAAQIQAGRKADMKLNPQKYLPGGKHYAKHGAEFAQAYPQQWAAAHGGGGAGGRSGANQPWGIGAFEGGGGGQYPGDPGAIQSSYTPQFDDPSTRQLEEFLMTQMQALEAQRGQQAQANVGFRGQQGEAQAATQRLVDFLGQRAGQLQQPAYTGAEQEILRTQALEPIERDRQAAQKRALEYNVGGRGFEPTSGIAIQSLNDVDAGYDRQRAQAQGDLAYRQINERRSREQEAQALMGLIPQIQRGAVGSDLQLQQMLDAALNRPREQGLQLSQELYRLPAQAQSDALAAMGVGPSPDAVYQQAMGLYGAQQQQANQGMNYYQMLGSILPYLMGQGG